MTTAMAAGLVGDLRLAARSLTTAPTVTLVTVVSLALGIGGSMALFSVFNGMTLRALPVREPRRLVTVTSNTALRFGFQAGGGWSYAMWQRFAGRGDVFAGAFAWTMQRVDTSESGETQPIDVLFASGDLFSTLGVPATLGGTFSAADDVRGSGADGAVAVISHEFWQRRLQGAANVIGTRLLLEGAAFSIIGVTPAGFVGIDVGQRFDVAVPLTAEALIRGPRALVNNPRALLLTVMLRLQPEQSIAAATAALRAMQPDIVGENAPQFLTEPFVLAPASTGISDRTGLRQRYKRPLLIVSVVCGLVVLMVCLNIANVLLARAAARRGELSLRLALGARTSHLVRLLLMESILTAIPGALLGMMLAVWAGHVLVSQLPAATAPIVLDVSPDWRVFGFTTMITIAAMVVCAVAPAIHASGVAPIESLQSVGLAVTHRQRRIAGALIVGQIAVSLVLLVAAGLFVGTAARLANVRLGFEADRLLVVTVNTAHAAIDPAARLDFYQRLVDAVASAPGVIDAAASQWTPLGGGGGVLSDAGGRRAESIRQVAFNFVTPNWFRTYQTTLGVGRDIAPTDGPGAARVAVINETLARQQFGDRFPVGRRIDVGPCGRDNGCEVIGVVADALYGRSLRDAAPPTVYVPLAQSAAAALPNSTAIRITARTNGDPTAVVGTVSSVLRAVDGNITYSFRRLQADVESSFAQERLVAIVASFFGGVGALLAALGVYGVTAFAVTRRRREIGLRLALGAAPRDAAATILHSVAVLVTIGAAIGVSVSLWLSQFVTPLLYGLRPRDPMTLAVAVVGLVVVATVAAGMPALRAARLDPAIVLREQ